MEWQKIIISIVSIVLTALATWLVNRVTAWFNEKLGDSKAAKYITEAIEVVRRCVKVTYQTYVEELKDKNMFDLECQKTALTKAKDMIVSQLSQEVKDYLTSVFGDLESWITSTIESTIYDLKNGSTSIEIDAQEQA